MPDKILMDIISKHLPYEIDMLRVVFLELSQLPEPETPEQHACKNALIESFAAHGRSLIDFFSNHNLKPTDAVASEFTTGYVCPFDASTEPLKTIRDKLNKQIFHLTKDRTIVDAEKFDVSTDGRTLLQNLESAIANFTRCLAANLPAFECKTKPIGGAPPFPGTSSHFEQTLLRRSQAMTTSIWRSSSIIQTPEPS
jgi:hypothetical protein